MDPDAPLLASINSLAMGGTNAHAILEAAPEPATTTPSTKKHHTVLLSARSVEALDEQTERLGQWVREHPMADLADLTYTLAVGRRPWEYRRAVRATSTDDLAYGLSATNSRRHRNSGPTKNPRVAFLMPGQGAQRPGMAARLYAQDPVFARHLDAQIDLFAEHGVDLAPLLVEEIDSSESGDILRAEIGRTSVTQPAIFAVETALAQALMDRGVQPHALLGHSIGEVAAAALAGVFSPEDAVRFVVARGQAMEDTEPGAMLWVALSAEEVLEDLSDGISVAAVNSAELVTVAGPVASIEALHAAWTEREVPCGRLEVTRAFHSQLMDPAAEKVSAVVAELDPQAPRLAVFSNVTGTHLTPEQATDPQYWADQMRGTVLFSEGVENLLRDGATTLIEVGPGTSLSAMVPSHAGVKLRSTLANQAGDEQESFEELLTTLWLDGVDLDWRPDYADQRRARLSLPGYPFRRTRHWLEPASVMNAGSPAPAPIRQAAPSTQRMVQATPATVGGGQGETFAPVAGTPIERYLRVLWQRLLGADDFEDDQSFFEIGGHSLLAMQMVTRLRRDGATDFEMAALFEAPTLAGLAAQLERIGMVPPTDESGAPAPGAMTEMGLDSPEITISIGTDDEGPRTGAREDADGDDAALLAEINGLSDEEVLARIKELGGGTDG
jgi:acyl transferase domain-containing protein